MPELSVKNLINQTLVELGARVQLPPAVVEFTEFAGRFNGGVPDLILDFYRGANGSIESNNSFLWYFWPIDKVLPGDIYLGIKGFCTDDDCRLELDTEFLMVFFDAMTCASIYAVYVDASSLIYGVIIEVTTRRYVSRDMDSFLGKLRNEPDCINVFPSSIDIDWVNQINR